jgi:hypothetical protein
MSALITLELTSPLAANDVIREIFIKIDGEN